MAREIWERDGPLCVIAGPGTGKTTNLARRVKYLVEDAGISPEEITVITFTRAAASEMRRRLCDPKDKRTFVSHHLQPKIISTMHSLGNRIIRERLTVLGYSTKPQVLRSKTKRKMLLEDAARIGGFSLKQATETKACRTEGWCDAQKDPKCKICDIYQALLRKTGTIDYDDQIILACRLLDEDPDFCCEFTDKCSHLLVDEFQDINAGQFRLIKRLTENNPTGLFVVGDDDQSIYSWRGGTPDYIRKFREHFGDDAKTETLRKSWRCNANILEAALRVVETFDKQRRQKPPFDYEDGGGEKITVHNVPSDQRETSILTGIVSKASAVFDVLILVPNREFADEISKALLRARVAVSRQLTKPGEGIPIFADLASWLQNERDSLALRLCLQHILDNQALSGIPGELSKKNDKRAHRQSALSEISALWKPVLDESSPDLWRALEANYDASELLTMCFTHLNALQSAYQSREPSSVQIERAICAFEPWSTSEKRDGDAAKMYKELAAWTSLVDHDFPADTANVRLMTFEKSKGLEAHTVCIVGCEDGTIPGDADGLDALAEKARLMFVAMTRAKSVLHLFHARKRSSAKVFRQVIKKGQKPDVGRSRFLKVLPEDRVTKQYYKPKKK